MTGKSSSDGRRVSPEEHRKAWEYALSYYPDAEHSGRPGRGILEDFTLLNNYVPDAFYGYLQLRQGAFDVGPQAALDERTKELILVAMGLASRKTNPPPLGHTRKALEAGASVAQIAELVALSIMYCGIISFDEGGRHILRAAAEFAGETPVNGSPVAHPEPVEDGAQ
jgi:alkylhydroperoxidase/carboxymuconolactone decarboxylase family protein YurZ